MTEQTAREFLSYARPAALRGTELMVAKNSTRKWRVFHERYVVCVCARASADWHYRGQMRVLTDNCYTLMEPGETHVNTIVPQPQDYKVLQVTTAVLEEAASELGISRTPHFSVTQDRNPAIIRAFERLAAAVAADETALEQQSRLAFCLRLLLENCVERPASKKLDGHAARAPIERAKLYLMERFNEPVSLDDLAAAAGLSRFHLLRTFARQTGLPPHAYQLHVRIERASLLLQAGAPPSVAAAAVGFADQSHFTRHFKRVAGVTPGRYTRGGN